LVETGSAPPAAGDEARGTADTRRTRDILDLLAKSSLFEGAPIGVLDDLATRMEPVRFDDGQMLCREGHKGDSVYIVAEGTVDIVITGSGGTGESVAMLQAGDVFGLASILEDRPRMASCFARGPLRALRLPARAFRELVHADGTAGSVFRVALLRALGDQVAYANAQFGQLQMARRKRSSELLARLGIEAHGRHVTREA
jgi:CRP-like cAMP-binding protein